MTERAPRPAGRGPVARVGSPPRGAAGPAGPSVVAGAGRFPGGWFPGGWSPGEWSPVEGFPVEGFPVEGFPVEGFPAEGFPVESLPVARFPVGGPSAGVSGGLFLRVFGEFREDGAVSAFAMSGRLRGRIEGRKEREPEPSIPIGRIPLDSCPLEAAWTPGFG